MTLEDRRWPLLRARSKAPAQAESRRKAGKGTSRQGQRAARTLPRSATSPTFTKEEDLHAYREMLLIRRFEEKAGQMYGMGLIGGFCHLYIGQEAVVVGMQMASKDGDQVITGYRDHGHMLACGMESQRRDGRADRPARRLFARQGRLDAHVLAARRTSTAATASSARRCRSAPASPSPTGTAENDTVSHDLFRRRRRQPGPGLRELQHGRSSGSCRSST